MDFLRKIFGKRSLPHGSGAPGGSFGGHESLEGGIKRLCLAAGIGPGELFRAMSGNTGTTIVDGNCSVTVSSWMVYHRRGSECYMSNLGALPGGEPGDPLRTGTVIDSGTGKPWFGPRRLSGAATAEIWRNGPIGPFKYDFPEVVRMMESQGYELMQNWFQGSATYLLQKVRVGGQLKVVWKLALSRRGGGVEGLSFVDANTGHLYILYLDRSKQKVDIDPEP